MSKLFVERQSKREFIDNFKHNGCIKLIFIKKYDKYKQVLTFLPNVIENIIIEYTHDVLDVDCNIVLSTIFGYVDINVDSDIIEFNDVIPFDTCGKPQLTDYWYNRGNCFMKKYYGHDLYFPNHGYENTSVISIMTHKRVYKYNIIIVKMILKLINHALNKN